MLNTQKYEDQLRARLKELDNRLHGIEDRLDEPVDDDVEERATEREDDEVLEQLGMAGQAEIEMIEAALGRLKNGTFGTCLSCGEQISEERLDVVPHAAQCRNCARDN